MNLPVPINPALPAELADLAGRTKEFLGASKAANTKRAYRSDWADFVTFAERTNLLALPSAPETVAMYLTHLAHAGRTAATIGRRLAAVRAAHEAAGYASPTGHPLVKATLAGIRRSLGVAPTRRKEAILVADLRHMLVQVPDGLMGIRDRALLLVGFAGAFRRRTLIDLNVEDLKFVPEGVIVAVRHSKTDQEGHGEVVGITAGHHVETCPVRSLQAWLETAGIAEGAVFRPVRQHCLRGQRLSDRAVALIVQKYVRKIGLDPRRFGGHSLRAGLVTSAAAAGANEWAIMRQTGHKNPATLARYVRETNLFRENVSAKLGL